MVKIPCGVQNGAVSADDDIQGRALRNGAPRGKLDVVGDDLGIVRSKTGQIATSYPPLFNNCFAFFVSSRPQSLYGFGHNTISSDIFTSQFFVRGFNDSLRIYNWGIKAALFHVA